MAEDRQTGREVRPYRKPELTKLGSIRVLTQRANSHTVTVQHNADKTDTYTW